jgi:hypothetical protein
VAAAATPSPQSPTGTPAKPAPASRTTDAVADATVAAGEEVRRGVETAAGTAGKATDNVFPRTTGVMSAMAAGAGQSTGAAAEAVSEIIRALPLGTEQHTIRP